MSAVLMGREKKAKPVGSRKGEKPGAESASSGSIRIKPDLTYKLRIIVEAEKTSVAEFLDPILRGPIEMHFRRVTDELKKLADQQPE